MAVQPVAASCRRAGGPMRASTRSQRPGTGRLSNNNNNNNNTTTTGDIRNLWRGGGGAARLLLGGCLGRDSGGEERKRRRARRQRSLFRWFLIFVFPTTLVIRHWRRILHLASFPVALYLWPEHGGHRLGREDKENTYLPCWTCRRQQGGSVGRHHAVPFFG